MKTNLLFLWILLVAATSLVACEMPHVGAPHHVIGSTLQPNAANGIPCGKMDKLDICQQARANSGELRWYRDHEWQYNGTRRNTSTAQDSPPLVCVAFSGGGIRSAAFSIGVLKGLFEKSIDGSNHKLLDYVDILSGTSGGSYALSWYYMQQAVNGHSDKEMFDSEGTAQHHLKEHASFVDMFKYLGSGFANVIVLSPLNALVNGVLGTHTNTSLAHHIYRSSIKDTFQEGNERTLDELNHIIQTHKLPYFIITTTSRIDESQLHHESLLRNTVFEFTPIRVGNDGLGYMSSSDESIRLNQIDDIVSVAGAAPDSSQVISGSAQRFLASILNADYGRYIRNYNDTRSQFRFFITKLAPFPFYFFTESYNRDMRGSEIYLSDGGHQENLGVYPLIRRQCQNIIIVDAEYDSNYEFGAYFKLKHAVEQEMRVTMELTPTQLCKTSSLPDHECRENHIDLIETQLIKNFESPGTRGEADARREGIPLACCFSGQHPITEGRIKYFPILRESPSLTPHVDWRELKMIYIKLSIDNDAFKGWDTLGEESRKEIRERVGVKAADYYAKSLRDECEVKYWWTCSFPQFSTAHQSFNAEQFEAYVDLGTTMVKHHLKARINGQDAISLEAK